MTRPFRLLFGLVLATTLLGLAPRLARAQAFQYPPARRVEHTDRYHGVTVSDPYRWFETDVRESPEIAAWVKAQNELTAKFLQPPPAREPIRQRLQTLWNYERYSPPVKAGPWYIYLRNDGLQNHAVLYTLDKLDGQPRMLLDPNQWSKDGSQALAALAPSSEGRYLAYGRSASGSDWQTWRIVELATGKELDDELKWIKFSNMAWLKDQSGFFYARYPEPAAGAEFQGLNLNQEIRFHRIGTPQAADALVYSRPDHPDWSFDVETTDDGKFLITSIRKADDEHYQILYKDLSAADAKQVTLVDNFDHQYYLAGSDGAKFYFLTDRDAPQRKLVEIDTARPDYKDWKVIIPQGQDTLRAVTLVGDELLAVSFHDAATRVSTYRLDGKHVRDVALPGIGTAAGFTGHRQDRETFYSFSNSVTPQTVYRYDIASGQSTLFKQPKLSFDPQDYQVEQVFYSSKDGTRVPMTISSKKGLKRDGSNPTLLYGYGGFGISLTPVFSVAALAWMEQGGVYAVPNLRGGGEYGEAWHAAGTRTQKQNVFDDFIAAAEWLISAKYTNSQKLAIQGGSNGGLLVAAVLIQRPTLFGACISDVPVTDMLRYHHFTDGRFWVTDYGSADADEAEFKALAAYSPYHNAKPGTHYPPTLVTTADTDDRVVPMHSFKFVAALQRAQAGDAPILLRVSTKAGHGSGKPTAQRIEEITDQFIFLDKTLHLSTPRK